MNVIKKCMQKSMYICIQSSNCLQKGEIKMTFADIVSKIDGIVWGWAMIVVLVGTHIFMTVRTGVIQRHLIKGIKLSV